MKRFTSFFACVATLLALPTSAKTLTIGLDLSRSNVLISSPEFARAAAPHVAREVAALEIGDTVVIRSFGARGIENVASRTLRITKANRPREVANAVARFIAELPAKNIGGQASTNILAFLRLGRFGCESGDGRVLLLTDGKESSIYAQPRDLVSGKPLPEPTPGALAGCDIKMIGFWYERGGESDPRAAEVARSVWENWMKTAGATFDAVAEL